MEYIVTRDYQGSIEPNSSDVKHFRFFKYIKREKGPNGKWKYYYDEDARSADRVKPKNEPETDTKNEVVEELSTDAARAEKIEEKKLEKTESKNVSEADLKEYEEIVNEVIRGKWDNGQKRWKDLEAAGYDWAHIQNLVNEKLGDPTRHPTNGDKKDTKSTAKTTANDEVKKGLSTDAAKKEQINARKTESSVEEQIKTQVKAKKVSKSGTNNTGSKTQTSKSAPRKSAATRITENQTSSANRKSTSDTINKGAAKLTTEVKDRSINDLLKNNRRQINSMSGSMTELIKRLRKGR